MLRAAQVRCIAYNRKRRLPTIVFAGFAEREFADRGLTPLQNRERLQHHGERRWKMLLSAERRIVAGSRGGCRRLSMSVSSFGRFSLPGGSVRLDCSVSCCQGRRRLEASIAEVESGKCDRVGSLGKSFGIIFSGRLLQLKARARVARVVLVFATILLLEGRPRAGRPSR